MANIKILYEDNHLLVVDKPESMPAQPDKSGDESLDVAAKEYIRHKHNKPGNVYLGLVHRLDRPTSGIVVLAKTDKAAGRMADLFRKREVIKTYVAMVECHSKPAPEAALRDVLVPLVNGGTAVSSGPEGKKGDSAKGKKAELTYKLELLSNDKKRALLRVDLHTGVKHQIRCQLAFRGLPVVGDFRYGAFAKPARPVAVEDGRAILLHAARIAFVHPVRKEEIEFLAPPPDFWLPFAAGFSNWPDDSRRWKSLLS